MNNFTSEFSIYDYEYLEYYINNTLNQHCGEIFPNKNTTAESLCAMNKLKVADIFCMSTLV